jgi:hypothetical protein
MTNTKKPITLMCVQPCIPYYAWQIEVMLTNFEKLGIHNHYNVHCLFAFNKNESDWEDKVSCIKKVESVLSHVASFYYYEDTRIYPISYISSIRPNLLKQHFKNNSELSDTCVFYHDCDIIFSKFPDFLDSLIDGDTWYVSNTISYIGHRYISSKGDDVLDLMCKIVGISPHLVEEKEEESGGAQYLMKGVDWRFFDKMEKDCERMFKEVTELNNQKKALDPSHHELQIWCADMWCLLWNAWLRGFETKIIPDMDFCWATDTIDTFEKRYIFHNAGVTSAISDNFFYKGNFMNNYPYLHECETYDQNKASYKYFEEIKLIGNKSCLL